MVSVYNDYIIIIQQLIFKVNIQIQISMSNPQEEFKRKYIGINTVVKNNPMSTQLISGRDRKKSQISKEKQNKKIITTVDKQVKPKQKTPNIYYEQCEAKFNVKTFNFRNLKQTATRRQADLTKTQQPPYTKTNREYFQKNINVKRKVPTEEPQGIEINVNIQNMALLKNKINPIQEIYQTNKKSDRSFLNQQQNPSKSRKVQKINNFVKNDDFECTEELVVKVNTDTTKTKIMEKQPLITRKPYQKQSPHQVKDTVLDTKQVIKKFEEEMNNINSTFQEQTIRQLDKRQEMYMIPPHYIQKKQKNFSWIMRATLVEWMMHVSYQFSLKRQTFHLSVNLIDLYMSKEPNLSKAQFQLIGAGAMFIASKLQQFQPKCSQQFANSTSRYSAQQVKEQQLRICNKLSYNLNPPTLFMWANRFMLQWDHYLDLDFTAMNHELFFHCQKVYFKKFDGGSSFKNFRILMQLLDCAILDIQTVQYKQKLLVCAFMYLVLGKGLNQFQVKKIVNSFPRSSRYLIDEYTLFNDLFSHFLQTSFGIVLIDLLPTIQYCATFFILNLTFDPPVAEDVVSSQIELQEYCCLQTYNQNTKGAVNKRFRGIYQ